MEDFLIGLIDACLDLGTLDESSLTFGAGRPMAMELIAVVWNYVALVGIGLTLIYFLMEMNQKLALEGRDLNMKSFMAPFLKLLIAIAVLSQGGKIVGLLLSLNDSFIQTMDATALITGTDATGGAETGYGALKEKIADEGLLFQLGLVIPILIMWLISMVLCLVWWYKSVVYKLEVLFRVAITPIGLADVYSGQNSNAIKYLKGFLVLGIYAASMILLPRIGVLMALGDIADADGIWEILKEVVKLAFIVPFAALSCANLARTAAKEALGA